MNRLPSGFALMESIHFIVPAKIDKQHTTVINKREDDSRVVIYAECPKAIELSSQFVRPKTLVERVPRKELHVLPKLPFEILVTPDSLLIGFLKAGIPKDPSHFQDLSEGLLWTPASLCLC